MNGIVRSYNATGQYGFIRPLIGEPQKELVVFFHRSVVRGAMPPVGAEVQFGVCRANKGMQAYDVRIVEVKIPRGNGQVTRGQPDGGHSQALES